MSELVIPDVGTIRILRKRYVVNGSEEGDLIDFITVTALKDKYPARTYFSKEDLATQIARKRAELLDFQGDPDDDRTNLVAAQTEIDELRAKVTELEVRNSALEDQLTQLLEADSEEGGLSPEDVEMNSVISPNAEILEDAKPPHHMSAEELLVKAAELGLEVNEGLARSDLVKIVNKALTDRKENE